MPYDTAAGAVKPANSENQALSSTEVEKSSGEVKANGSAHPASDPFDPVNLRLDVSFSGTVGVKRLLTTVPVRKPHRQEFVRVHPAPEYRLTPAAIIELQGERETYLVLPQLVPEIAGQCAYVTLYLAITRQKIPLIWPVKLPSETGRQMDWHRSMAEAAEKAINDWVRITANMARGAYDIELATGNLGEPEWPELSMQEILRIAFKDRLIDDYDHAVIRRLRGEI